MWENHYDRTNSARRRALLAPSLAEDGRSWICRLKTKMGFIPFVLRNCKSKLYVTNTTTLQNLIEYSLVKADTDINLTNIATILEALRCFLHSHVTLKHGNDLALCKTNLKTSCLPYTIPCSFLSDHWEWPHIRFQICSYNNKMRKRSLTIEAS